VGASAGTAGRSLRGELASVIGVASVLEPSEYGPYCHDATIQRGLRGVPDAVVCPQDPAGVARVLRWCYGREVAIVPRGGGTGLAGGAVPVDGGVVLSMERLRGVRALEPELGRVHVEAGLSTAHVARLARENGLLFAPDPGAAEQSQIGGNVATNAGGPHAFKYGPTGSCVAGLEVALAPGELTRVGAGTRKDVSGYDLRALLVGSEGTLGIITAVRLALPPAPEATLPLVAFLPDPQAGQRAVLALLASGVLPAVLDFLDARTFAAAAASFPFPGEPVRERAFVLVLELDGSAAEVERELEAVRETLAGESLIALERPEAGALWRWRDGLNGLLAGIRGGKVSEDICVPPERLGEAIEAVYAIGAELSLECCAWGHAGDGIVHGTFLAERSVEEERVRALAAGERLLEHALRLGGSITGEHGVGYVKRAALAAQWDEPTLAAYRHVKEALDPKGLLNPGKKEPVGGTPRPPLGA
jgi:glycolate dehydrogenase FAD-linked subunit